MSVLTIVLIAAGSLSVIFVLVYLLARKVDNYGVVDIFWTYSVGGLASFYALAGNGWPIRRALLAAMVVVWSLRLGTHVLVRVIRHHPDEDKRYQQLRKEWARKLTPMMLGFFQMQAVSVILLGSAVLPSSFNGIAELRAVEYAGVIIWLIAISGEALADAQLAAFKRTPAAKSGVCNVGLWHYSRHPNYFFEWLNWVAYFIFALGSPWGWIAIIAPASILYLLLRVTGIPMTEQQSLRSRGDAYRRYQQTTSAFIPWFPKPSARSAKS